jgi:hypothetical protein
LPALMTSLKNFLGDHLPGSATQQRAASMSNEQTSPTGERSSYQPNLERK